MFDFFGRLNLMEVKGERRVGSVVTCLGSILMSKKEGAESKDPY